MLINLHIENVAVIDKTDIEFTENLNVLSGETGAGKSIIIDSINMILGARVNKSIIRYGENKALCQALFSVNASVKQLITAMDIQIDDNELLLSRTISSDGRSICRINGMLVTATHFRDLAPYLINIHGQHDNQALLSDAHHINFLDDFAYQELLPVLNEYKNAYQKFKEAKSKIKSFSINESEKSYKLEFLGHQIEELERAHLTVGEDEILQNQLESMENFEAISENLGATYDFLYSNDSSAIDGIAFAVKQLERLTSYKKDFEELYNRLFNLQYELQDITDTVRSYRDLLEFDPTKLLKLQKRLDLLKTLKRKYNTDILGMLEHLHAIKAELSDISLSDHLIKECEGELKLIKITLKDLSLQISSIRKSTATQLSRKIEFELSELNMPKSRFVISITRANEFLQNGIDKVEFLISTNAGTPPYPLAKVASGGELSRVMLAIKTVLSKTECVDTLIFDEIDTGVSGQAAQKISEKLAQISRNKQVLCITHLAQIASMADHHLFIEKNVIDEKTVTSVRSLSNEECISELSRIITGLKSSDTATKHSQMLIKQACEFKENL